jgi:hypothetical protein
MWGRRGLSAVIMAFFAIGWIGLQAGCNGSGGSSRTPAANGELPAEVKAEERYYDQRVSTRGHAYEPYLAEYYRPGK